MPYANRFRITSRQIKTGHQWIIYIQDRELDSDNITDLNPGEVPIEVTYTPVGFYAGEPYWNLSRTSVEITFQDDATGVLSEIIGADDERYKIYVTGNVDAQGTWFVLPDSYRYTLYGPTTGRLRGTDRVDDLKRIPFAQDDGTLYAGRADLVTIFSRCLDSTGLDLGISTHCNIFPHFGSNELDTTDDPLKNLFLDQETFRDADDNPFSKFDVLEQILMKFPGTLQLFQSENRWFIIGRKRSESTTDNYKVYQYDNDGTADGVDPTFNHPLRFDANTASTDTELFKSGTIVSGTKPIGAAASTYYHKNPFADLFGNLSFEDGLNDTVGGTPLVFNGPGYAAGIKDIQIDGLTPSVNIPQGYRFTIDSDSTGTEYSTTSDTVVGGGGVATSMKFEPGLAESIADNDAITFHEDHGSWERSNSTTHTTQLEGQNPEDGDVRALRLNVEFNASAAYGDWVRQESSGTFAGTTGQRLRTGWYIRAEGTGATTDVMHAFKVYVTGTSTTWYHRHSDSTWQTTDPGVQEVNLNTFEWLDEDWHFVQINTAELHDGSNDITGTLTIEFYEGREHDGGGSQNITYIYVDNVSNPVIVLSNNTVANEATQTLLTYTGNVNRSEPKRPTFVFGDGPSTGHRSRLTATDSTGATVDITSDWSYLPTIIASNVSLEQLWASRMLLEHGKSNKRMRATVFTSEGSTPPKPHYYANIVNPENSNQFDYTWIDMTYRPVNHHEIFTASWVQFQETVEADQQCSVDIKPNTALFSGIEVNQGLVCEATSDFTPIPRLDFLWWSGNEQAATVANENAIYKSTIPNNGTDSVPWETDAEPSDNEIINVGGTSINDAVIHLRVDRTAGYIFTTGYTANEARRHDLAGGNELDSNLTAWGLSVDRTNERLCIYDLSTFKEYDYDFSEIRTLRTKSVTVEGTPAYDQSGTYMFAAMLNDGGTTDRIYRITLSDLTKTNVVDMTSLAISSLDTAEMIVDEEAEKVFFLSTESTRKIYSFDYPGGGSLTTVISSAGRGLALDRLNQKVMYSDTNGDLYRADYDGTNSEKIFDYTANLEVMALDAGLS